MIISTRDTWIITEAVCLGVLNRPDKGHGERDEGDSARLRKLFPERYFTESGKIYFLAPVLTTEAGGFEAAFDSS